MSSNGLASGNHSLEAVCHALCEVIERDANTLWRVSGERAQEQRRLDLETVDDPACRELLAQLDEAELDVLAWDTTTDVRVASVLCSVVDRGPNAGPPMPAVQGSGCHPCRRIALSRALTEAVQGRLTRISGARDDLSLTAFDDASALRSSRDAREKLRQAPCVSFAELPNAENETLDADLRTICDALVTANLRQILVLNLTRPDLNIPVVRVVVPHLEAMNEIPGYALGERARRAMGAA
jgi:ribosomal protein S12 methylthiotransferase accessory factor